METNETQAPSFAGLYRLEARFLEPYRWALLVALAGMVVQSFLLLPIPLLQGWVLDRLVAQPKAPALASTIVLALAATVACHLARMALAWTLATTMSRITCTASSSASRCRTSTASRPAA
jgi:hypothetical protein